MRRIFRLFIIAPLLVSVFMSLVSKADFKLSGSDKAHNYLVAGLDEAANNTDVLFVLSYSPENALCSAVQIPRDTYCEYKGNFVKINSIFSRSKQSGEKDKESMKRLSSYIEDTLGIEIDGYIGMSFENFSDYIDIIGGVYINIPEGFPAENYPIHINIGENLLNGKDSLTFVRHRSSYITGDLGRLDAQKIFIDGLFHTLFERVSTKTLIKLIGTAPIKPIFDFPLLDFAEFILKYSDDIRSAGFNILTLPGEALTDDAGTSYYVINKNAASDAVSKYIFGKKCDFDPEFKFKSRTEKSFINSYEKDLISYKVYSDGEIIEITVG